MSLLVFEAYVELVAFDLCVAQGDFTALYSRVRTYPLGKAESATDLTERICAAVDVACIWYWKEVLCLQRSAATACLLKKHGIRAQMAIGVQLLPFKAHAWVEVDGGVVNDKPYMPEIYAVIDRCSTAYPR
jgi:Transglutaminase-like superfamily